jgi:hypothetical protein
VAFVDHASTSSPSYPHSELSAGEWQIGDRPILSLAAHASGTYSPGHPLEVFVIFQTYIYAGEGDLSEMDPIARVVWTYRERVEMSEDGGITTTSESTPLWIDVAAEDDPVHVSPAQSRRLGSWFDPSERSALPADDDGANPDSSGGESAH